MCGIVGYVGTEYDRKAQEVVIGGLSRLEYRGYDSAGIAVCGAGGIEIRKKEGKLANLKKALESQPLPDALTAIGHTRWATHGSPSDVNSHPHFSYDHKLALVHNGIIENADNYRRVLEGEGIECISSTDTEVVAHLLARAVSQDGATSDQLGTSDYRVATMCPELPASAAVGAARLLNAMSQVTAELEGSFTLLAIHQDAPGVIVAARRSSPLVIGLSEGANYLGSDVLAFAEHTDHALEIDQDELVLVGANSVHVFDALGNLVVSTRGHEVTTAPQVKERDYRIDFDTDRVGKDGWPTFMEKEIHEQPQGVAKTLANRLDAQGYLTLDELRISQHVLRSVDKAIVIACGTASYAGMVARYAIEHWCRIPCEVELASEFRYRDPVVNQRTLVIAISQSGETMDTIMAIRYAREQGAKVVAIVNTPGSTISRESDAVLLTHAGPEIAVASTKAFTAQITACYLFGLYLAQVRRNKYPDEIADYLEKLGQIPALMQKVLDQGESVRQIARQMCGEESFIYLGRHVGFPIALEGALKLKEIAYIHAEGFAAGELKHGPIALIDEGQPVFVIVPTPRRPELHRKVLANVQEVRARGARTIVVAEEGDHTVDEFSEVVFRVPPAPTLYLPLLTIIPLQIFACEVATAKGYNVDQPRNLAKSVTVE